MTRVIADLARWRDWTVVGTFEVPRRQPWQAVLAAPEFGPAMHRPLPGSSVRAHMHPAAPRGPPWSPRLPRFPRGRLRARTPAPRRPAVTNAVAPRRR